MKMNISGIDSPGFAAPAEKAIRIFVCGAGVIGANPAAELFAAGKDAALPAKGKGADKAEQDAEKHLFGV